MGELRNTIRSQAESHELETRNLLREANAEILKIPQTSQEQIFRWSMEERQPFKSSGEGYRDALIWINFLEIAETLEEADLLILVTANKADFCDKHGHLGPDLRDDLARLDKPPAVRVFADLASFLADIEPTLNALRFHRHEANLEWEDRANAEEAFDEIRQRVIEVVQTLVGQEVGATHDDHEDFRLDLPLEWLDTTIYAVDPEAGFLRVAALR